MAEAAEETADWTLGQIIATGVEAVLFAFAIGVACWAGFWAKRAALTGDETVKITRKIGEAQTRAYVLLAQSEITMRDDGKSKATITFENAGQTPADDLRIMAKTSLLNYPDPGQIVTVRPPYMSKFPMRPTGTTIIVDEQRFSEEARTAMSGGERAIYVMGEADYIDIFNQKRATKFRLVYTGPWGGTHALTIAQDGNERT